MKDNVTLIPARKKAGNGVKTKEEKPRLRVAAYCRVSTDSDEQGVVLQKRHKQAGMRRNPENTKPMLSLRAKYESDR